MHVRRRRVSEAYLWPVRLHADRLIVITAQLFEPTKRRAPAFDLTELLIGQAFAAGAGRFFEDLDLAVDAIRDDADQPRRDSCWRWCLIAGVVEGSLVRIRSNIPYPEPL